MKNKTLTCGSPWCYSFQLVNNSKAGDLCRFACGCHMLYPPRIRVIYEHNNSRFKSIPDTIVRHSSFYELCLIHKNISTTLGQQVYQVKKSTNLALKTVIGLRPFLMQSDLSIENGLFRLKLKSGFLRSRKRVFSTQQRVFRLDPPVGTLSRKSVTRVS